MAEPPQLLSPPPPPPTTLHPAIGATRFAPSSRFCNGDIIGPSATAAINQHSHRLMRPVITGSANSSAFPPPCLEAIDLPAPRTALGCLPRDGAVGRGPQRCGSWPPRDVGRGPSVVGGHDSSRLEIGDALGCGSLLPRDVGCKDVGHCSGWLGVVVSPHPPVAVGRGSPRVTVPRGFESRFAMAKGWRDPTGCPMDVGRGSSWQWVIAPHGGGLWAP